jgi:hypothetical protein
VSALLRIGEIKVESTKMRLLGEVVVHVRIVPNELGKRLKDSELYNVSPTVGYKKGATNRWSIFESSAVSNSTIANSNLDELSGRLYEREIGFGNIWLYSHISLIK